MKIFAVSGSLREKSVNRTILECFAALAPSECRIDSYDRLSDLAAFNPDVADEDAPEPVTDLRARVAAADLVIISSPEYASGPPGSLKNALDWLVGTGEMYGKRAILAHPTTRAMRATESLERTLNMMGAEVRTDAFVPVDLAEFAEGVTARPKFEAAVAQAFERLSEAERA